MILSPRSEDAEVVVGVDLDEEQVVGDADVEDDVKEDEDIADVKEPAAEGEEFSRPKGVPDFDWNVYRMVSGAHEDFYAKFKAMWA